MNFLIDNWYVFVGIIALFCIFGYVIYAFLKMPSTEQIGKIKEWLLYAVTKAESELGGGTGQIKLRYVYDMFIGKFPWFAKIISFDSFSVMVDEALDEMKKILETNTAVQKLVEEEKI